MIEQLINTFFIFLQKNNITQSAAAKQLNIGRAHLSNIYHRRDNPSTALLLRMEEMMQNGNYKINPKKLQSR